MITQDVIITFEYDPEKVGHPSEWDWGWLMFYNEYKRCVSIDYAFPVNAQGNLQ